MNEIERIKKVYEKRKIEKKAEIYSYLNIGNLFIIHQRENNILELFKKYGFTNFSKLSVLDIGCGEGGFLRELIRYGSKPENLYGIDLLEDRIQRAKYLSPNINFRCGDASKLPFDDSFFDMVTQFTTFTSVLDKEMREQIASEMLRVLKPKGILVWYDFHKDNPKNQDVKGVRKREIFMLFPDCNIYLARVTLAPPIARMIAPYSIILCELLGKIPFLCTHYIGAIVKRKISPKKN